MLGVCLSWGNREFYDETNPERTRSLSDRAMGGVEAINQIIDEIEAPTWENA